MKRLLAVLLFVSALVPLAAADQAVIAVLDFSTDGVSRSEMKTIVVLLSSALFQTGRFTVIDVSERERLLQELEFSVADWTDESSLLQLGRLLSAERIVVGNIGKVGSRYILSTKILETATARTLNVADGIYLSLDALVDDLFALAEKLAGVPPAAPERPPAAAVEETAPAAAEPAAPAPEAEEPRRARRDRREDAPAVPADGAGNFWALGVEAGANIPLGASAQALAVGVPALVRLSYVLDRDRGAVSLGLLSGLQYQGTRAEVRYQYHLLMAPLGAEVGYTTRWVSPWHLRVGAAGGVTVNYVIYKETYPFRDNLLNVSPFVAPSLGVGYGLSARLSLELNAYLWTVFYTDATYVGIAPAFGLRIAL